jgi:GDP-mannose 4,6-dehydratase
MVRKVLVTGASGFIGSHLVEELIKRGDQVTALNEYNSFGDTGWLKEVAGDFETIDGDVRDSEFIRKLVETIDSVYNLASLIAIPYSYQAGRSYFETNTFGLLNLVEALKGTDKRLVHVSTSEVYGTPKNVPIRETDAINPQSPYAASKAAADSLVSAYTKSFDLNTLVIRPFNTFGPRQSMRAIIPTVASQVLSDSTEICIGNLESKRDMTYVSDTVAGIILGMESNLRDDVIHLGTGQTHSVLQIVNYIQEITGTAKKITIESHRIRPINSEIQVLQSDPQKAIDLLAWNPQTEFKNGLSLTIDWISNKTSYHKTERKYFI